MTRSLEYSSIKPTIPIILASGSESRKLMLEEAGIEFNVIVSGTDEDLLKDQISNLPFEQQVVHLAKAKAQSVSMENTDKVVIGGDQMCVLEDTVFNKPGSKSKLSFKSFSFLIVTYFVVVILLSFKNFFSVSRC